MTRKDKDFDRQMAIAREVMEKHKVALSVLAKGENSPYMTDEFRARLEKSAERLAKYPQGRPDPCDRETMKFTRPSASHRAGLAPLNATQARG